MFATEAKEEQAAPATEQPAADAKPAALKPSGIPQILRIPQPVKWNQHAHNKAKGVPSKRTNAWRKRKARMIARDEMHRLRKYQTAT